MTKRKGEYKVLALSLAPSRELPAVISAKWKLQQRAPGNRHCRPAMFNDAQSVQPAPAKHAKPKQRTHRRVLVGLGWRSRAGSGRFCGQSNSLDAGFPPFPFFSLFLSSYHRHSPSILPSFKLFVLPCEMLTVLPLEGEEQPSSRSHGLTR